MRWIPFVLVACVGCSTYSVRRAALVPHMAPVTTNGQPMAEPIELALGTSNLGSAGDPSEGANGDGLYIPRLDVNGGLRGRIGNATIGLIADYGSGDGAMATASDMPRPEGDTWGGGVMMAYSFGDGPLRLGAELDLMRYTIPWKESWTCVEDCEYATMPAVRSGKEEVAVIALGLVPSYRSGRWTIYGGATLRNHPTIDKGDVIQFEIHDPVTAGPVNVVLSAGAEVTLASTVRAGLVVYQPLGEEPVAYTPTVAAQLTVGLSPQ